MNKSCRIFVKLSILVKSIICELVYLQLWIFEVWCSVLVDRNIQWSSMVNYAILQASYAKLCNTNVITNGVLHNLVNFGNFWVCGLKSMKKRIVSAAVKNCRLNGRCFSVGFEGALVCICCCSCWYVCVCTEYCLSSGGSTSEHR